MKESKKRSSRIAEIWNSLWNNNEGSNEIEDPDQNNPDVDLFNAALTKQKEYYETLKIKTNKTRNKDRNKDGNIDKNKARIDPDREVENERY